MKRFTQFVTEAQISQGGLKKVLKVYEKLLTKASGSEVWPYGRGYYPAPLMSGEEYILTNAKRQAWGFNYIGGEIISISVWKKGKFRTIINGGTKDPEFTPCDVTVDVTESNLMKIGEFLKDLLVNPKTGKFAIRDGKLMKEEFAEYVKDEFITEGKRKLRSQEEFWQIVVKHERSLGYDPSRMSQDDLDILELEADIFIPVWVNKYGKGKAPKSGRGANATWDLTVFDPMNADFINVKSGDTDGKQRQHSGLDLPEVRKATSTIRTWRARIENPGPEDANYYKVDPDSLFSQLEKRVIKLVKSVHTFFVVGGPGIGKTYVINQKLREMGYKELSLDNLGDSADDMDTTNPKYYQVVSGSISLFKMVQAVFKAKKAGQIIMFDDADGFLDNKAAADMLKAMLGSGDSRWVTMDTKDFANVGQLKPEQQAQAEEMLYNLNNGKTHLYEPEDLNVGGTPMFSPKDGHFLNKWRGGVDLVSKDGRPKVPNKFKYEGKMAFISNRTYDKIDSAVRSRIGNMLDMSLTATEVAIRMKSLMKKNVLGRKDVPSHIKEEIMDVLIAYMDDRTISPEDLNMRTFLACELEWITFPDMNLQDELRFTLQPNYAELLRR